MNAIKTTDRLVMNDGATESAPRRKRQRLTPDQQELAASHVPLARSLAKPMKEKWPLEIEEFDSAACYALVEAAQSFNADRNVKFATFARIRIIGALSDTQREIFSRKYERDMPNARTYRYVPGGEEKGILMMTSQDAPVADQVDAVEEVEHWLRKLPSRLALACREVYLKDRTQLQVAKALGCSKSRVSVLHAEALDLLRETGVVMAAASERGFDVSRN